MSSASLRSTLDALASSFADAVLAAIRSASLGELVGGPARGQRAAAEDQTTRFRPGNNKTTRVVETSHGRLARRSPEDIAKTLGLVVAALKASKEGMRAEELRAFLQIDKRELPRVLHEGLRSKKLRSKGRKRATTYFTA